MIKKKLINYYKGYDIYKVSDACGQVIYISEKQHASDGITIVDKDISLLYKKIDNIIKKIRINYILENKRRIR